MEPIDPAPPESLSKRVVQGGIWVFALRIAYRTFYEFIIVGIDKKVYGRKDYGNQHGDNRLIPLRAGDKRGRFAKVSYSSLPQSVVGGMIRE